MHKIELLDCFARNLQQKLATTRKYYPVILYFIFQEVKRIQDG